MKFQSTLPARGATSITNVTRLTLRNFNPRSPHGERRTKCRCYPSFDYFNPRSPHGERQHKPQKTVGTANFNPRSPHGERLVEWGGADELEISIHAPRTGSDAQFLHLHFLSAISIHAPRTGSDLKEYTPVVTCGISIHAPRTGSDHGERGLYLINLRFQSTLPARGATYLLHSVERFSNYFNPRSPHGERLTTIFLSWQAM